MMKTSTLDVNLVSNYNYCLPKELIASYPANPRESARLLVYLRDTKEVIHANFYDLFLYLPKDICVALNNTKVIKARIFGKKESGGNIELLLDSPTSNHQFKVHIKGKVRKDTKLLFDDDLSASVLKLNDDGTRIVSFTHEQKEVNISQLYKILEQIGHVPLPPYIKRDDENIDIDEYQSVFASSAGAVAAPTASLHFSHEMFEKLTKLYNSFFITLHIGAGTFKGVDGEKIHEHIMHKEFYNIPKNASSLIESKMPILCVGTTTTRVIEYFARTKKQSGYCDLFLNPTNKPIRTNYLLTNFHLPKSTLIMLVASFIGLEETLRIYKIAVEEKYRFFSYGDAMLII